MMDPVPHPLVAELVLQLLKKRRAEGFDAAEKQKVAEQLNAAPNPQLNAAIAARAAPLTAQQEQLLDAAINPVLDKEPNKLSDDERKRVAGLADVIEIPKLVAIDGYLGGTVEVQQPGLQGKWRILYIDSKLQTWRLIRDDDILAFASMDDDDAAFNRRDVVWVDAEVLTSTGAAPPRPERQAQFLRGEFTRAGDLTDPGAGGSPSPSTGVFCATTPRCCTIKVKP